MSENLQLKKKLYSANFYNSLSNVIIIITEKYLAVKVRMRGGEF